MRAVGDSEVPVDGGTAVQEGADRPVFVANGDFHYLCVSCGSLLAAGMDPQFMTRRVRIRCARCPDCEYRRRITGAGRPAAAAGSSVMAGRSASRSPDDDGGLRLLALRRVSRYSTRASPQRPLRPASEPITGLVLAADGSKRLGQPKQLLPYGEVPLLAHVLRRRANVLSASSCACLGGGADEVRQRTDFDGVTVVENRHFGDDRSVLAAR